MAETANPFLVMLAYSGFVVVFAVLTAAASSLVSRYMAPGRLKTALLIVRTPEYAFLCVVGLYLFAFVLWKVLS